MRVTHLIPQDSGTEPCRVRRRLWQSQGVTAWSHHWGERGTQDLGHLAAQVCSCSLPLGRQDRWGVLPRWGLLNPEEVSAPSRVLRPSQVDSCISPGKERSPQESFLLPQGHFCPTSEFSVLSRAFMPPQGGFCPQGEFPWGNSCRS